MEQVSNILATRDYYSRETNICFGNTCTSVNIGSGCDKYSQIFIRGYIAPLDPIYATYIDCTSNVSSSGRISAMYSSVLGLPMMYITQMRSNSSVFETIRVNKSMNTCPILVIIEYIHTCFARKYSQKRVFVNAHEYLHPKNEYKYEYWIACVLKYLYSQIHTRSIPCIKLGPTQEVCIGVNGHKG